MASMLSLTRTALPHLAPAPEAAVGAVAPPSLAGAVAATGDGTGLHRQHLRPAAGPPLIPGPALILVAVDVPPAVAAKTIEDTAVDAAAAPHHATGPALTPTAAHPLQTGTRSADTTGPAPDPPAVRAGTGGRLAGSDACCPDPHPQPTGAAQSQNLQDALSV